MAHIWTHMDSYEFMLEILSWDNADKDIEQEIKDLGLKFKFSILLHKTKKNALGIFPVHSFL